MITKQELQALAHLLARTPMTAAEALWVRDLLARLVTPPAQEQTHEQAAP